MVRYLRARDWNAKAALKLLQGSFEWRQAFKPTQITPDMVEKGE